jgi:hypothetical protein
MTDACSGHIVAAKAMPSFEESAFNSFSRDRHVSSVQKLMNRVPKAQQDHGVLDGFLKSVRTLAPICKSVIELNYLADMQRVMNMAKSGSPDGSDRAPTLPELSKQLTSVRSIHGLRSPLQPLRGNDKLGLASLHRRKEPRHAAVADPLLLNRLHHQ